MNELNDFLNLISEAKKESENKIGNHTIENLSNKIKENSFSTLLETTKVISEEQPSSILEEKFELKQIKKPDTSSIFEKIKDNSFVSLLETEIVKSKEIEKTDKIKEEEFISLFSAVNLSLKEEQIIEQKESPENDIEQEIIEQEIIEQEVTLEETFPLEEKIKIIPEILVEAPVKKTIDLTDGSQYDKLFKTNVDLFNQPNLPKVPTELKALTDKVKYMEDWLTKISLAGPGGGEVNLRYLDDVNDKTIQDGRFLRYNGASDTFEFVQLSGGGAPQIQSDWEQTDNTSVDYIKNKPDLTSIDTLDSVTTRGNTTLNSINISSATANYFQVNVTPSSVPVITSGMIAWNDQEKTFDMGLINGVVLQVGQETHMRVKAYEEINNGQTVMFAGVTGEHVLARKYDPSIPGFISEWFIGVATQNLAHNDFGYITVYGTVHDVNTNGWTEGQILYANNTTPGGLTTSVPTPGTPHIVVAAVTKKSGTGHLFVRPTVRPPISDLPDVNISSAANGNVLLYNGSIWTNSFVSANTLTGNTLNATITDSNLTKVGTLSNLTVSNTINGSITGNANTVTNGVYTTSSYSNPSWITSIAYDKLSGAPANVSSFTNDSGYLTSVSANTLTGNTLKSTVVNSSLTSLGTLTSLNVSSPNAGYAAIISANTYEGVKQWAFAGASNPAITPSYWLQFPDGTNQSTAYTGNANTVTNGIYTTDTGTVTNTMLAGSITNNKLANSSITINGTSINLGSSATLTTAASSLTGTTLNSNVVSSSLTTVGTLTGLTSNGIVTISNAGALAHGSAQLYINGSTYSRIDFSAVYGAPVAGDRSTGTRLLFNPGTGLGRMDSAIGMSSTTLWTSVQDPTFNFGWYAGDGALGGTPITLMTLSGSGILTIPQTNSVVNNSATKKAFNIGTSGQIFDDGNMHIHASASNLWLNALDSSDINIGTQYNSGSGSTVNFGKNLVANSGNVTANAATAFIAGVAAESGIAIQIPREGAIRNLTNGATNMYFDVSNGGSTHGAFVFRSSNSFTSIVNMSPTAITFNSGATVTSQSPAIARTPFNSALDTVVTVDNIKYRISNQGGVFPQIASASGSQVDVCYDVLGVVSGVGITNAENSGYLLLANGTWLSIYSTHGMDARGDRLTAHITDKNASKIYRATFMKTNNSSNVDGYNIIVERIL